MTEILNAHGSRNDIFVVGMTPSDLGPDLLAFIRGLCARSGPFGGDGVYFYDARPHLPQAWFFNPDGSPSEFCGNGMRCLGRVIMDLRGTGTAVIRSGQREYTVRRAPGPAGVPQVTLEHPPVDFDRPVVVGPALLDPDLEFTAVSIPNPHLVAIVDKYVESDLIAMGEQIAARPDTFPAGANLSVLLPLDGASPGGHDPDEVFVRTFERGAGLTASCGSGMAAARAVYSRLGRAAPERGVLIRNAGGTAEVSLAVRDGRWCPVLTGNATFVYRAHVDPGRLPADPVLERYPEEARAYAAVEEQNTARLRAAGIL
jgi:diaminopimelate epimerase